MARVPRSRSQVVPLQTTPRGDGLAVTWPAIPRATRVKVSLLDEAGHRLTTQRAGASAGRIVFDRLATAGRTVLVELAAYQDSGVQVGHGDLRYAA